MKNTNEPKKDIPEEIKKQLEIKKDILLNDKIVKK